MRLHAIGAIAGIAMLAGCAAQTGTNPSKPTLASIQAQATAAVADFNALGANLVAQGQVDPATVTLIEGKVAAANAALQAVQPGSATVASVASNVATVLQTELPQLGASPTEQQTILAVVAALQVFAADYGGGTPGGGVPILAAPAPR